MTCTYLNFLQIIYHSLRLRIPHIIHSLIMNDWKKIYESTSPIKAQLAKAYLVEEHQIEAVILNKQDSSYLFGLCEVHVPMQDAVLAKFLLENEGGLN